MALVLAGALSLVTIAIAWLIFRPLLAIVLIAIAAGLGYPVVTKLRAANT